MKKLIGLLIFSLIILVSVQSQVNGAAGIRFGFPIGFHEIQNDSKNWLSLNSMKEKTAYGFNISAYTFYSFTGFLSLQAELSLTAGMGIKGEFDKDHYANATYTCLDIPVLLKIHFVNNPGNQFGVMGGPLFTTALGKFRIRYTNYSNPDEEYDIKASHFGMTFGLFYSHFIEMANIVLDLRYIHDFKSSQINISKSVSGDFIKRRGIIISVGVEFAF